MYTKEEVQMFRSMDERGFVLEEHQELAVLREDIAALMAGNERLRAALHDLVGRCMDDFNGGRKLRRGDVDRARAALEAAHD